MKKIQLPRFTHRLTVESLAERLALIDYNTKVWLLFEDSDFGWWSVATGKDHPYDTTDCGIVWAASEWLHWKTKDYNPEETAARLIDELVQALEHIQEYREELPELLRN